MYHWLTTDLEAPPGFEPGIKVLQTYALPLGYSALLERVITSYSIHYTKLYELLLEEQITTDQDDSDALADRLNREQQIEKLHRQADRIDKWLRKNDANKYH